MKKEININVPKHVIDVLKNVDIFQTPLNMTANKIKKELKKLDNSE